MKKTRTIVVEVELSDEEKELVRLLEIERDAMAALEVHREKRDALIQKLFRDYGWTGRDIEPHAGVSNVYVYRLVRDRRGERKS